MSREQSSSEEKIYFNWTKGKNLRPFIMFQLIFITPIEYLKVMLDANFCTKRELSLRFHLQQIDFGRTNQNYQELF